MSDALYNTYERELLFIRQMAQGFARKYPAAASRLMLEPNRSADPHVERLIEAFALLTARVQTKLEDDFPELTDALLNVLYPHYLAPIPSMTVVQMELEPANAKPDGLVVPAGTRLHTQRIGDAACLFRTSYPVTLWPLEVTFAQLQSPPFPPGIEAPPDTEAVLRLHVECQGEMGFSALALERLRLHLYGANELIAELYELIFNDAIRVEFHSLAENGRQEPIAPEPEECLGQVGFERDEGLLPYRNQSFLGYRLLTEFFAFPYKFHFVDLGGWDRVAEGDFGRKVEVVVYLDRTVSNLEREIDATAFRLGCTPVVNLFRKSTEPIRLTHRKHEYRVIPDVHRQDEMEVYSVDRVTSADPDSTRRYKPFYSFRHDNPWNPADEDETYWYASRRPSHREDDAGTEVFLDLVDLNFDPRVPADSVLVVDTTCTNRDLPVKLQQIGETLSFELESAMPLKRVRCLRTPTPPRRPPLRRHAHWRLISHLALNHLSIVDPVEGRATLQEMLRLYDFTDLEEGQQRAAVNRQLIEGITGVSSRRVVGRTREEISGGICRGVEVTIELDEQKYVGTGAFLFASVLERFLGLYASINSFSQLVVRAKNGDAVMRRWRPRSGELQLL